VTLDRIALLIQLLTGISHHPAHVWALLRPPAGLDNAVSGAPCHRA
jgi:hypothetical protein